jgi:hypothetical protein
MVELRSHSQRVIRDLRLGVRMTQTYPGQADSIRVFVWRGLLVKQKLLALLPA